ncbi:MAG: MBL fold metallo-hydrolase [Christensenellales bacterium]|nr:MBL fold metallo-hydrolase [Christensenellales bacterium]
MAELDIQTVTGGPLDVNTYVVGCADADCCVLIDPGAEEERVAEAVGQRRVAAVLLTHGHFDHMLHAQPWLDRGAKLYVHAQDAQALRSPSLNLCQVINASLVLPQADVLLEESDVVSEAGLELTVLHTPGHTPGGVCYLADNVLFSGDTLFYSTYGRTDLPGGDEREIRRSLMRLMELPEETVAYPGHGMKTKIAWERRNFA